jgi:hypothetical protein
VRLLWPGFRSDRKLDGPSTCGRLSSGWEEGEMEYSRGSTSCEIYSRPEQRANWKSKTATRFEWETAVE